MDKKKSLKDVEIDDIRGFEEFIEGQSNDGNFIPRGVGGGSKKNESGFEHFTFLINDAERLTRLKVLLREKLPYSARFDQSRKLIKEQQDEIEMMKKKLFEVCDKSNSSYRKSLKDIFDSFFGPTQGQP